MKKDYIKKLYEERTNNNLSFQDMANILGVSKPYYWQIENKKRNLSYKMAKKIANVFNLKPDDIFYKEIS